MSAQEQQGEIPDGAQTGWQERTTDKNAKYQVKAEEYDIEEAGGSGDAPAASGASFKDVAVNWRVGTEGAPSKEVQELTSITYYKLKKAPWYSVHTYALTIMSKDTYNFEFTDEEPDSYTINVYQNAGSHYVEYSSPRPTIVKISGN